eukprot:4999498-Pleurochrysis_carterae.AAC.3
MFTSAGGNCSLHTFQILVSKRKIDRLIFRLNNQPLIFSGCILKKLVLRVIDWLHLQLAQGQVLDTGKSAAAFCVAAGIFEYLTRSIRNGSDRYDKLILGIPVSTFARQRVYELYVLLIMIQHYSLSTVYRQY